MHAISSYHGNRPTNTETDRTSFLKITGHVIRDVIVCKRLHFDCLCLCSTRTLREKRSDFSRVINGLRYFDVTFGLIVILIIIIIIILFAQNTIKVDSGYVN